jgi:tetratricopeptide (TPR) repeat protein
LSELVGLPLLVLGGGLLVGLAVAWALAKREPHRGAADLRLRIADLEAERDETYAKLRGAEGVGLADPDRDALELTAARVLRDLDTARKELGSESPRAPKTAGSAIAQPAKSGESGGFFARHPALGGALFGGGMVGLVALLVFWAQRDARPAPRDEGATTMAPAAPPGGIDRGEPQLPPMVAGEVAALRDRIAASPDDAGLRRRLAELLLAHGQFFDAFQESRQLLERAPEDAMGHYVSGVVLYTMGNAEVALEHFGSARAAEPGFAPAAIVEGIVRLQLDDRDAAVATWTAGLAAAGGTEPRLEHLLRLAHEGKSATEILSTPPPG